MSRKTTTREVNKYLEREHRLYRTAKSHTCSVAEGSKFLQGKKTIRDGHGIIYLDAVCLTIPVHISRKSCYAINNILARSASCSRRRVISRGHLRCMLWYKNIVANNIVPARCPPNMHAWLLA